ncbi:carbamoyltransferase HypF [Streptomyces sp. E11-3]|uniref:carbamoyltransferase HypF n=1 Tax=Streptomyces sp. E11-3 TaxID=3110112 RepID=UPI00397FADED
MVRSVRRFEVTGIVQGVGFRPFVYRTATRLGLDGWVANVDGHVEGLVAGASGAVEEFGGRLRRDAPVLAEVRRVRMSTTAESGPAVGSGFAVLSSGPTGVPATAREIPPDAAICAACLAELFDAGDRRYRYPFINCTDCGPRATVIEDLPYDRIRTTMRHFPLCVPCATEYADPGERRFHAEPLACPACGPRLCWGELTGEAALKAAVSVVDAGGIAAVKGLGGYQLVCDATDAAAVGELRRRKRRPGKPFAVMVADLAAAGRLARIGGTERTALTSPARPVVLLRARAGARATLAAGVHPGTDRVGLFLPTTGLHHLLLRDVGRPLVVTSGNLADEPIAVDDAEALAALGGVSPIFADQPAAAGAVHRRAAGSPSYWTYLGDSAVRRRGSLPAQWGLPCSSAAESLGKQSRAWGRVPGVAGPRRSERRPLAPVADGFLGHDRPIQARYDDSVVQVTGRTVLTVRRARGLAPAPLPLRVPAPVPLAGAGAQLKHTFTLAAADRAHVGPHTGDLADVATYDAFLTSYAGLRRLTGITPRVIAHDLHPGYLSTQWAKEQPVRRIGVQHHHAHVAAVAAEHGLTGPFTGVAYDGLGFGDDGTLWGGEILVADLAGYRRVGRFATAPLPGGEAAVRHPWRMALGYLYGAEPLGTPRPHDWLTREFTGRLDHRAVDTVRAMVERDLNCPRASSAGRLFDAVASLIGLADSVSYEGEAAVRLEAAAGSQRVLPLDHRLVRADGLWVYDPTPTLVDLLDRLAADEPVGRCAAAFHTTLAAVTAELVARAVAEGAPRTVCLAGGCFTNRRLLTEVRRRLRAQGLRVLVGRAVPVGDGGISYGQAAVAAARLARE